MNDEYLSLRDLFLDATRDYFFYFLGHIQKLATSRGFKDLKECLDTPYEDGGIGMSIDQIKHQLRTDPWELDEIPRKRIAIDLGLVDSPRKDRYFLGETFDGGFYEYPFESSIHKFLKYDKNHVLTLDHMTYIFHIDIYVDGDFDLANDYKEELKDLDYKTPIFWCQRNGIDHAFLNVKSALCDDTLDAEQGFICHIHYDKKPSIQKDHWYIATDNGYEPVYKRKQALANGWPVDGSFSVISDEVIEWSGLPYYDAFEKASQIKGAKIVPSNYERDAIGDGWIDYI